MAEKTFAEYETEGWQQNAAVYDQFDLPLTSQAFAPILDSLGEVRGRNLLELACGTGHLAAEAVSRGASVAGVDAASNMVDIAKRTTPTNAEFRVGFAESLPFEDGSFDAVVCSFGFLHFSDPEAVIQEAFRVLKPGGRLSLTVWQAPDKGNEFFAVVFGTIMQQGEMDVGLPPAPDAFAIARPESGTPMFTGAGFGDISYEEVPVVQPITGPDTAYDFVVNGGVRSRMLFERQSQENQRRIKDALSESVSSYIDRGHTGIPSPAVLVTATKPS